MLKTIKILIKLRLAGIKAKVVKKVDDDFCEVSEWLANYSGE